MIAMYKFWCYLVKPKYEGKETFCYMDTDSFIARMKKDIIYANSN